MFAKKRGADLACEVALGESKRFAFRADGDEKFVAISARIIPSIGDAALGFELTDDLRHHRILIFTCGSTDLDGDGFQIIAIAPEAAATVPGNPK